MKNFEIPEIERIVLVSEGTMSMGIESLPEGEGGGF